MFGLKETISVHIAPHSSHGGGCGTDNHASSLNEGGGGGTDLCDGSTAVDGRFKKAHATDIVKSSLLKTRLITRSHGISNS